MKKIVLLSVCVCGMLFGACKQQKETKPVAEETTAVEEVVTSFDGVYTGRLPIEVNKGVKTSLNLKRDSTYHLSMVCYELGGLEYQEHGKIRFDEDVITLIDNDGHAPKHFKLTADGISLLDQNKKVAAGDVASLYLLQKRS